MLGISSAVASSTFPPSLPPPADPLRPLLPVAVERVTDTLTGTAAAMLGHTSPRHSRSPGTMPSEASSRGDARGGERQS